MGAEGFRGASSLLYHRRSPSAIVRIEPVEIAGPRAGTRTSRCGRIISAPASSRSPARPRTRSRPPAAARQRRRRDRWVAAGATSPLYRDATGDELVYVHAAPPCSRACSAGWRSRAGDYVVDPGRRRRTDGWCRRPTWRCCVISATRSRRGPGAVPQRPRPAARRRAVQRARPARPGSRATARGRRGRAGARAHPRRAQRARARDPSVRRRSAGTATSTRGR